jgi:hypothetical protein
MQKLITKQIEKALEKQGDTSQMNPENIMAVAKFFGGAGTWYLYDWDRETAGKDGEATDFGFPPRSDTDPPNRLWVFANLGDPTYAECGTILLQELEITKVPPLGTNIERDIHWKPMPLSKVIETIKAGGHL